LVGRCRFETRVANEADLSAGKTPNARLMRSKPRLKVFQPTEMHFERERVRVHLLDLSATGALVHHPSPPPNGAMVQIKCAGMMRAARVMHQDGTRFGVQFLAPLTDEQVSAAVTG
jgi:hypothetical protein